MVVQHGSEEMLGAYPWQTRPDDEPLSVEEACEALWQCEGDIRLAAERLKIGSLVLRKFVERSSRCRAVIKEADACLGDEASTLLRQAVRDPDARRQDWAIRYVLNSKNTREKGWSSTEDASSNLAGPLINLAPITVQWQNGEKFGPPPAPAAPAIIDVTPSTKPTGSDEQS